MKMLLIDDQQHAKIVNLNPTDRIDVVDQFIPCGECGLGVLHEHTTHGTCHQCSLKDMDPILAKDWMWDHPGVFRKNFGDRITVLAGTGEYRFDFTFCNEKHDLGWGPDWSIDVQDWCKDKVQLTERGCFGPEEMAELEAVYEYLYADMMRTGSNTDWTIEAGGLSCPNGCRIDNEEYEVEPFHITKEMIWGISCAEELTNKQHRQFAELQNLILTWLATEVK